MSLIIACVILSIACVALFIALVAMMTYRDGPDI
jgi:hypothetical protein